jgi:hypothetical protein
LMAGAVGAVASERVGVTALEEAVEREAGTQVKAAWPGGRHGARSRLRAAPLRSPPPLAVAQARRQSCRPVDPPRREAGTQYLRTPRWSGWAYPSASQECFPDLTSCCGCPLACVKRWCVRRAQRIKACSTIIPQNINPPARSVSLPTSVKDVMTRAPLSGG